MPNTLTTASQLQCPHSGVVQIVSSNFKAKADGAFIVRPSDTFIIAGCTFTLPGGVVHPCMTVKWISPPGKVKADGGPALHKDSSGLCLAADQAPQGSVLINSTQSKVSGI
jgi:hypothetical protein